MMTFKQFIDEAKYVPEWEKECWVHAINKTLKTPDEKVKQLALENGWDGKSFGAAIKVVISIVYDLMGKMPSLELTRDSKGMTARQFASSKLAVGRGLVFTRGHVMPMVNGAVSNYNGHGEEEVVVIATF